MGRKGRERINMTQKRVKNYNQKTKISFFFLEDACVRATADGGAEPSRGS